MADVAWATDVRVRLMQRYPYSLVYIVRDPKIVIIAVAHQRRRPGYWLSRTPRSPRLCREKGIVTGSFLAAYT